MANNLTFQFNGIRLQPQDDSLFALNTLYEMAGRPANQDPAQWKRLPQTEKLVNYLKKSGRKDKELLITQRGKGGGTLACLELTESYAQYLEPSIRNPKTNEGYVYLVRCEVYIKIGVAKNVETRISNIQGGNPFPVELLDFFHSNNTLADEKYLHEKLAKYHHQREWFLVPADMLKDLSWFGSQW